MERIVFKGASMIIKKILVATIFLSASIVFPLFSLSKSDFDRVVDFSVTLKELSLTIANKAAASVNKDKIYVINGTVTSVTPNKANSFEIEAGDIVNPLSFVTKLRNMKDPLSARLFAALPKSLQAELIGYTGSQAQAGMITNLVRELAKITREESLYAGGVKQSISLSPDLKVMVEKNRNREESGYLNRLIMEEAFPGEIAKHTLLVEIAASEWTGYETINVYKSILRVSGTGSYGFFVRKDKDVEPTDYVPVFSMIMAVVKIDRTVLLENGEEVWLLDGIYARQVK